MTHERTKQKSKSENTNSFEEPDKKKRFVLIGSKAKPGELGKDVPEAALRKEIKNLGEAGERKRGRRETMGGEGER